MKKILLIFSILLISCNTKDKKEKKTTIPVLQDDTLVQKKQTIISNTEKKISFNVINRELKINNLTIKKSNYKDVIESLGKPDRTEELDNYYGSGNGKHMILSYLNSKFEIWDDKLMKINIKDESFLINENIKCGMLFNNLEKKYSESFNAKLTSIPEELKKYDNCIFISIFGDQEGFYVAATNDTIKNILYTSSDF